MRVLIVIKSRQFTKGQKFFLVMAVFVCSLLLYANSVTFNLISAPINVGEIVAYSALAIAFGLTLIMLTLVIRDKRSTLSAIKQKSNVNDLSRSVQTSDVVPSQTISQEIEKVDSNDSNKPQMVSPSFVDLKESTIAVETNLADIQTSNGTDVPQVLALPKAKSNKKRIVLMFIIAVAVGLLFFANAVAFELISLPYYSIYAAVAIIVPLVAIELTLILSGKIKGLGTRIKRFTAESLIPNKVKEQDQAPDIISAPVIAQTNTKKVDTYDELSRQLGIENVINKIGTDTTEKQKQLPKKPVIPPTKVICPACRQEFILPIYERNYIVDFGRTKRSNLIKQCPHCQTPIPLKSNSLTEEENFWED
jgi:hypothetical protein